MIKKILFFIGVIIVVILSFKYYGSDNTQSIYVKECRSNIGKYVVICGKEYKVIEYSTCDNTYILDNKEKIKADFIEGYFFEK